jgi:hypothetical protein
MTNISNGKDEASKVVVSKELSAVRGIYKLHFTTFGPSRELDCTEFWKSLKD